MYNFNIFEPTYNKAIDHCANIICCARANNKPVKALHLQPSFYEWFKGGVKELMKDKESADTLDQMNFDGVEIHKSSIFQTKPIIIEYYDQLN